MRIAELDTSRPQRRGSEFAELLGRVRQAGLLGRRQTYYTLKIVSHVLLYLAGWAAFVLLGDSWWQLLTAAYLAVLFTQTGFLGHDAGHGQIFRTRRADRVAGLLLGNLGIGLAYGWWVDKHHRHHAHPNQEGFDPDISGDFVGQTRNADLFLLAGTTRLTGPGSQAAPCRG